MSDSIKDHSGKKYIRKIYSCVEIGKFIEIDVYSVIDAFTTGNPAADHAIKKLLCPGTRGKGDTVQDFLEAIDAIKRAIQLYGVKDERTETY